MNLNVIQGLPVQTLQQALRDWVDFDGASWLLAKCLGLMPDIEWNPGDVRYPGADMKAAFWTDNLFGNTLDRILTELVALGAVDKNADGQYRWHEGFSWEVAATQDDPVPCGDAS